jgi:hypothetical protein
MSKSSHYLRRYLRRYILPACLLGLVAVQANAQKPAWVPVAELLLGSMGNSDAHMMAEVMNRCTALNMTLSGLTATDSPDVSKGYENQALHLIQNGILIELNSEKQQTGIEPDIDRLSDVAVGAVKDMLSVYNQWLNDNYDDAGSYFNNDFEIEMKGCELAVKLVLQMSSG